MALVLTIISENIVGKLGKATGMTVVSTMLNFPSSLEADILRRSRAE